MPPNDPERARDRRAARGIDLQAGRAEEQGGRQRRARWMTSCAWRHWRRPRRCARMRISMLRALLIKQKQWDRAIVGAGGIPPQFPAKPAAGGCHAQSRRGLLGIEPARPGGGRVRADRADRPARSADVQREATLQAADLYDKAGNTAKSRSMLEAFVKHFPQPLNPAMEARNKLSLIAAKAGDTVARDYWLRDIIAADRAAGAARTDRSRALAAKATLTLAAPAREEFKRIKLVAPLKKSLAEKRKAMEAALKAYEAGRRLSGGRGDYRGDLRERGTVPAARQGPDEFGAPEESYTRTNWNSTTCCSRSRRSRSRRRRSNCMKSMPRGPRTAPTMSGCRRALPRWRNSIQADTARWKSVSSWSNRFVSIGALALLGGGCHSAPPQPAHATAPQRARGAGSRCAGRGRGSDRRCPRCSRAAAPAVPAVGRQRRERRAGSRRARHSNTRRPCR